MDVPFLIAAKCLVIRFFQRYIALEMKGQFFYATAGMEVDKQNALPRFWIQYNKISFEKHD